MAQVGAGKINKRPCTEDEGFRNWQILNNFITEVNAGSADSLKVLVSAADTTEDYLFPSLTTAATRDTNADPLIAAQIASPAGNETVTLFLDSSAVTGYNGSGLWAFCINNGSIVWYDASTFGGGGAGTDILVKVSGTDTTSEYLHTSMKDQVVYASGTDLVVGAAIADASANEKLRAFVDVDAIEGYHATDFKLLSINDGEASNVSSYSTFDAVGDELITNSTFVDNLSASETFIEALIANTTFLNALIVAILVNPTYISDGAVELINFIYHSYVKGPIDAAVRVGGGPTIRPTTIEVEVCELNVIGDLEPTGELLEVEYREGEELPQLDSGHVYAGEALRVGSATPVALIIYCKEWEE